VGHGVFAFFFKREIYHINVKGKPNLTNPSVCFSITNDHILLSIFSGDDSKNVSFIIFCENISQNYTKIN